MELDKRDISYVKFVERDERFEHNVNCPSFKNAEV